MTQTCRHCSRSYAITEDDRAFYTKLQLPLPTSCPSCRCQSRLVWRNERTLYARECDLCHKKIISLYHQTSPYTVYCYDCWYSDKWSATSFGQPINFKRPFFEQFKELQLKVPRLYALVVNNENSEYTNGSLGNKDCYMIFASDHNEVTMYSYGIFSSANSVDILNGKSCELCYDCIGCTNCFKVMYSEDASNCNSSYFLLDCKGCSDCFMSYGLRNQKFVWENQQLTAEEYQVRLAKVQLNSYQTMQRLRQHFIELKKKHTFKYYHGQNNDQFSGDYLERCHNTYQAFECYETDNCKFITHGNQIKDCYDGYMNVDHTELGYQLVGVTEAYNVQFAVAFYGGKDAMYMDSCKQVSNSFGCVGLQHKQFCILNKEYSEPEYYQVRDRLIEHMKTTGEWGEFFPVTNAPFAYNETAAQELFPLQRAAVEQLGWQWFESEHQAIQYSTYRTPDDITKVKDDITQTFLTCEQCKKSYKILATELHFYRQQLIPIPRSCFACRHTRRLHDRNPRALWQRRCMCTQIDHDHHNQCATTFETAYSIDNPRLVYCEPCYDKTIH